MEKKWKCLNFKEKLAVIKMICVEKRNIREVIAHFKCGKTQIYRILREKDKIIEKYRSNENINLNRMRETTSRYTEMDKMVLDWYLESKAKNMTISGPLLQQKAKEVSEMLNIGTFSASNGWLQSFKNRHGIILGRYGGTHKALPEEAKLLESLFKLTDNNLENACDTNQCVSAEIDQVDLDEVQETTNKNVENSNDKEIEEIYYEEVPTRTQVSSYISAIKHYAKIKGENDLFEKIMALGFTLDSSTADTETSIRCKTVIDTTHNRSNVSTSAPKVKYPNENLIFLDECWEEETSQRNELCDNKIDVTMTIDKNVLEYHQSCTDNITDLKKEPLEEFESNPERNDFLERFQPESNNVRNDAEHPIQIFFRSMAATVMTFPPDLISETRMKVCELVTGMELRVLREQSLKNHV